MGPCIKIHSLEDNKQHNAEELSHIINQYCLERKYVLKISHFLNKSNEENYNKKLESLKKQLSEIPDSEVFLQYLHSGLNRPVEHRWQRSDPIDKTPLTHKIHAYYSRKIVKTCFNIRDKDRGKPRPEVFEPESTILRGSLLNNIDHINKLYIMIKPFGYDFPDIFEAGDMSFELYELFNPLYVCEKKGSGPEPIVINGIRTDPMSNSLYTKLYKTYIRSRAYAVK